MYQDGETLFYYLTLYNENYAMPAMPAGAAPGILQGLYKIRPAAGAKRFSSRLKDGR